MLSSRGEGASCHSICFTDRDHTHGRHTLKSLFPINFSFFVNSISIHCGTWHDAKGTSGKCLVEEKTDNVALFWGGGNRGICSTLPHIILVFHKCSCLNMAVIGIEEVMWSMSMRKVSSLISLQLRLMGTSHHI